MNFHFEPLQQKHLKIVFEWLEEDFVKEFWDNTEAHKNDIRCFAGGRKTLSTYADGQYVYWITYFEHQPFGLIMSIQETGDADIGVLKLSVLASEGHTYGLDFMIGARAYFGKGLGAKTLEAFMHYFKEQVDPNVRLFMIDPAADNPRAFHVYQKAGFKYVADFIMTGMVSGANKLHHLLTKEMK
ncbi:MAG: GNAT family N-acetyltransferase [Candidatus Nucleicultricaceae bacterium]|jgi:RimJ/RimL family protein N-acetyltransferase